MHTDDAVTTSYDQHAAAFAAEAAHSPYNAHYDRPAVLDLLGELTERVVLDAGCGPGLYVTDLLARGAHVIAIDASASMIDLARRHAAGQITLRQHDLTQPLYWLSNNTVDIVLLALVIHYIDDRIALLRELHRVLRPGGHLIVSTSHPTADWLTAEGSYFDTGWVQQRWSCGITHRFWRQPLQTWCAEFTAAGFTIDAITEHQPASEMARTHPAEYDTLTHQPGFIAYRLSKAATSDGGIDGVA
ncbi:MULTISPECIES: class I SAM-dependent methyltransferase [Nocardia]|jgi:SAM-dependent methyltransferase|uniref:Methyltransferase family protein n=1 Tax=Nocardia ignorata TaxID=145285 RepID=A0A4R6PK36_NOCIG|nr:MULTISPECIES: class I SAM-dependent methyltransferase [Nocardia]MBC7300903.1 class I SAM-dependent methyltransferase [Nocardia sp.]TDP38517.1 methyltransferase family protein [Nocardia ignorata]